jgi:hypothetical protein
MRQPPKEILSERQKSKNRLRFFDFLPLYKILFDPDGGREGGDSTFVTVSSPALERIMFY